MLAYTLFKRLLMRPIARTFRPWVRGEENIPATGGVILASSHLSYGETVLLPAMIRRRMTFPVKAEMFQMPGPWGRTVGWFLTAVGQVPIDRSGGRASAQGLSPVMQELENGGVIGIFPEGTRSPTGQLFKAKTGVARMALEAGVPVVPVGMVGTQFRRNRLGIPVMDHPGIIIGKPLDFSEWAGREGELKVLRHVTDEVMAAIQRLTGQEYVDVYASRVKFGDLSGADLSRFVLERPGHGRPLPPERPAPASAPGGATSGEATGEQRSIDPEPTQA